MSKCTCTYCGAEYSLEESAYCCPFCNDGKAWQKCGACGTFGPVDILGRMSYCRSCCSVVAVSVSETLPCSSCRFEFEEKCVKEVNINAYYDEGTREFECPHHEKKTALRPALWASRHELDPAAIEALPGLKDVELVQKDVLWPADAEGCSKLAVELLSEYSLILGVFPAQAVEAFVECHYVGWEGIQPSGRVKSTVSVPETEPDQKKVRPFRFVRWATII